MTINYKELCAPIIQASKECSSKMIKQLEPKLKELGFFNHFQQVKNYSDYMRALDNSPFLKAIMNNAAKYNNINLYSCEEPRINKDGQIAKTAYTIVNSNGEPTYHYINQGKTLGCSDIVSVKYDGEPVDALVFNVIFEVINHNGGNIELLQLPNYSDSEVEAMFR